MTNIQLENRHYQIIKDILSKYPYQLYAYGSRVKGNSQKYSDLDLCYFDIPSLEISKIREEFTKSNLPFFVELVNWKRMNSNFQQSIQADLIQI